MNDSERQLLINQFKEGLESARDRADRACNALFKMRYALKSEADGWARSPAPEHTLMQKTLLHLMEDCDRAWNACNAQESLVKPEGSPRARETNNYLTLIGCLLELLTKSTSKPAYGNQEAVILELLSRFPKVEGVAKSTLGDRFAKAKRVLTDRQKI